MQVTFDWVSLASALGAIQGLLLAGVLVAHRRNRLPNRLLAALMVAFTLYLAEAVCYASGVIRVYPHVFGISYPLPWVFGPLVYLYSLAASDRAWRFRRLHALHFVPVAAVVLVTLPIYMMGGAEKLALYDRIWAGDAPPLIAVISALMFVSGISYSVATVAHLRRHRQRVERSYSNTEHVNLRWLLWLAGAAAAIWLLATALLIAGLFPAEPRPSDTDHVALAIAVLIYAIGYRGLRQSEVFQYDTPPEDSPAGSAVPSRPLPEDSAEEGVVGSIGRADPRAERAGLGDAEASRLETGLLALMASEHPYRDPDLTLPDLAGQLGTTSHKLSELLNTRLGKSFYDFVNDYRVDDVRRRMQEPKSKHLKVLALAMDAGFASKSTFNDVFKKRTGQTPSTYRKALAG